MFEAKGLVAEHGLRRRPPGAQSRKKAEEQGFKSPRARHQPNEPSQNPRTAIGQFSQYHQERAIGGQCMKQAQQTWVKRTKP